MQVIMNEDQVKDSILVESINTNKITHDIMIVNNNSNEVKVPKDLCEKIITYVENNYDGHYIYDLILQLKDCLD